MPPIPRPPPAFVPRVIYQTERKDPKVVSLSVWGCVLATYTLAIHDFQQPLVSALVANSSASLIGVLSASIVFGGNYKYARTLVSEVTQVAPQEIGLRVHSIFGTKSSDVQQFMLKDFTFANEDHKQILFHVKSKDGKKDQRFFFKKNGEIEHFILDAIRPVPAKPLSSIAASAIPKRRDIRKQMRS